MPYRDEEQAEQDDELAGTEGRVAVEDRRRGRVQDGHQRGDRGAQLRGEPCGAPRGRPQHGGEADGEESTTTFDAYDTVLVDGHQALAPNIVAGRVQSIPVRTVRVSGARLTWRFER
ncbi:hypothetical protein [Streptomyces soliscabiei]|uniref:hypothetical protein n=1 Tax=Streptomyces soliscabiei TaxID=588897 RepID=UPI0029A4C386|nr:hypothetical protein [Streptomyces sp. NY05-11A]MDX2677354.1 hypothetical protein [Streptomyces sp. NY05-11A]